MRLTVFVFTLVTLLWQIPAMGLPKAAEHEEAPVVIVPDTPRPRQPTTPTRKEVTKKKNSPDVTKKPHRPATPKNHKKRGA